MKDMKGKIAFAILCGIFGIILSIQFKTVNNPLRSGLFANFRAQQVTAELRDLRSEKEHLAKELSEIENRLREYESFEADDNTIIKNLNLDLERYQFLSGNSNVEGPGIIITIEEEVEDGKNSFIMLYNDLLLAIINELNASTAEAISINGLRYTSSTEVYYSSNSVLINSEQTTLPYVIKAIGNPETLEAALNMRYRIIWNMRQEEGIKVTIEKKDHIVIPKVTEIINYKYAKPVEGS
ncbi:DUF881 domain-containing protein [Alkaliphilus serpentinus]|uniref:DUF881 domain-containing protein n=1 Tax=Alkaliphilus serpentinus TaxID=1482731 RepID=A0A833HRF0_9FIRM|nr:DUF881 domain-containing protein [Alkaliphilus serpentinus]KAB3533184.1 DUF881 domain-containing protein [Alkaliphilus serpentinus]